MFFLNCNGLSDDKIVSFTENKYDSIVQFLQKFIKSLKAMPDDWSDTICWGSLLLGIFMIKQFVSFSLIVLSTYDIRTIEILSFLPLKNNSDWDFESF